MPSTRRSARVRSRTATARPPSAIQARGLCRKSGLFLRIGNAPPIVGKNAALAELSLFYLRIESVGTSYWELCTREETIFAEVEVCFVDAAGAHLHIPCVIVARTAMGRLVDFRFDVDPSPIPTQRSTMAS